MLLVVKPSCWPWEWFSWAKLSYSKETGDWAGKDDTHCILSAALILQKQLAFMTSHCGLPVRVFQLQIEDSQALRVKSTEIESSTARLRSVVTISESYFSLMSVSSHRFLWLPFQEKTVGSPVEHSLVCLESGSRERDALFQGIQQSRGTGYCHPEGVNTPKVWRSMFPGLLQWLSNTDTSVEGQERCLRAQARWHAKCSELGGLRSLKNSIRMKLSVSSCPHMVGS